MNRLKQIRQLENIDRKDFIDILTSCLVVIIDSREKKFDHIKKDFEKYGILNISRKMNFCDYSFYIDKNLFNTKFKKEYLDRDIFFDEVICIERKASLDEIIQNFTSNRDRFEREFVKAVEKKCKVKVLIEDDYLNLILGNYRSKASRKAIVASMFTFENRYNINFIFVKKEGAANYIYNFFKYFLYGII